MESHELAETEPGGRRDTESVVAGGSQGMGEAESGQSTKHDGLSVSAFKP